MRSLPDLPYECRPIPIASPMQLLWTARVHGGPRPPLAGARVLDIGCGDGAHTLALAFHHREMKLEGVDLDARAIDAAHAGAERLGLTNVHFEVRDLGEYEVEPESYDYVIVHGVYSWVDAGRRDALLSLVHRAMKREGLGYVSFNALPGWSVRGRVRAALMAEPPETFAVARARLAGLVGLLEARDDPWAVLLRHELERARAAPDAYLLHEYLAPHNQAFSLDAFVDEARSHGLTWVADAQFDQAEGRVIPALREALGPLGSTPLARDGLVDLLGYRQLHAGVLRREDGVTHPPAGARLLEEGFIAGALGSPTGQLDLAREVDARLVRSDGLEVTVRAPLGKMALVILGARYPEALGFEALLAAATRELEGAGLGVDAADEAELVEGLLELYARGAIEIRAIDPTLTSAIGPRPAATPLARFEAERGAVLSTALHTLIPLEPVERAIVARLDGSLEPEALAESLVEAALEGSLELEGAPPGPAERLRPFLVEAVDRTLLFLSRWGLLAR